MWPLVPHDATAVEVPSLGHAVGRCGWMSLCCANCLPGTTRGSRPIGLAYLVAVQLALQVFASMLSRAAVDRLLDFSRVRARRAEP
jgi:hypothetical protein